MPVTAIIFLFMFASSLILTFFRPAYGAIFNIFLYFLAPAHQWWYPDIPDIRYALILNAAIILSFFLSYKNLTEIRILDVPHFRWLMVLIALVLLSTLYAVKSDVHQRFIDVIVKIWLFVFIFYKVIDRQKYLDWAIGAYCGGAFYASYRAWEIGRRFGARLESVKLADGTDANGVAIAILISIPILVFYVFWGKNKYLRFGSLAALAFNMNALVLLNSRGAFLGLMCAIIYMFYRMIRAPEGKRVYLKVFLAVGLSLGVLAYMGDATFWERMQTIETQQETVSRTHVNRTEYWWKTFDMLNDHPLGTGAGGYEMLSSEYLPKEWLTEGFRSVHSTWFEVLSSFGFQGLFVFWLYLFFCFYEGKKVRLKLQEQKNGDQFRYYQSIALESSLIGYMAAATFLNSFFVEFTYWIPMFIAAFYRLYYVRNDTAEESLPEPLPSA